MARKPTKISKTRQQTHRFLYFDLAHTGSGEDFHYIDIARRMSEMNRRLYRQGMCYHIANISVHDSQGSAEVRFATAPNTWTTYAAWKLAFDGWKRQRAEVMKDTALTPGKWSDFKVYLNKDMVNDTDWPSVLNIENEALGGGVWDYANMTFAKDGTQHDDYAIGLLGSNSFNSVISDETSGDDPSYDGYLGAIAVLQNQRKQINEPDQVVAANQVIFGPVHSTITQDIVEEIIDEGDDAPYSVSNYVGASEPDSGNDAFTARECHIASTYSPMAMVGGFPVPCGLLQVETKSDGNNTIGILIELVPGDYKGVHALPMGA